jgi:CheY-like chemotaxis protein
MDRIFCRQNVNLTIHSKRLRLFNNYIVNFMSDQTHILLIDDDPLIHMSFDMILFGSKYKKTSIIDPDEAISYQQYKVKYDEPDIIFVDLMIGALCGIDVIRSIRKDSSFDNIPIILYTGYTNKITQDIALLKTLNIFRVLRKPIAKNDLLSAINECMQNNQNSGPR